LSFRKHETGIKLSFVSLTHMSYWRAAFSLFYQTKVHDITAYKQNKLWHIHYVILRHVTSSTV